MRSWVALTDSTVVADFIGVYSGNSSWLTAEDSIVESTMCAAFAETAGRVDLKTTEIAGCVGSVLNASVILTDVNQTAPGEGWAAAPRVTLWARVKAVIVFTSRLRPRTRSSRPSTKRR